MKNVIYFFLLITALNSYVKAQVAVDAGWNLVGATTTISVSAVTTDPPGIIVSDFFGYNTTGTTYYIASTLEEGKGYWIKVSSSGIIYGFEPLFVCGMSKVNYEYKYYSTVQIGTQCWLKENLDVGTMIFGSASQTNNGIIEKYCYDDNETNCQLYGGLYQWDEVMQYVITPGVQGICPPGWHIPTIAEFIVLKTAVGYDGNSLKAVGQGSPPGAGTNTSGFSALLAGARGASGSFSTFGDYADFWSSTEYPSAGPAADYLYLIGWSSIIIDDYSNKASGFSVRCLKD